MTYIEFYDPVSVENIATCLSYMPDRVVLIGDSKPVKARIVHYQRVFADRGHPEVEFIPRSISKTNLTTAVQELNRLVDAYDDCVFDITGGDEVLLLALGMVCATRKDKKIQVHKINLRSGTVYDCDRDGQTVFRDVPRLSVEENIRIYGGDVVYGGIHSVDTYRWDLTDDFCADVDAMWRICRGIGQNWNIWLIILDAICAQSASHGLSVSASVQDVKDSLPPSIRYEFGFGFIRSLREAGLLTRFEDDGTTVSVGFKNEQIKRCLTVEGQVLELKMYIIAKQAAEGDAPVYNDALCGVKIDWDADVHEEDFADVENEIDILLMHGVIPVFISCKNGGVDPDELYKLHTVAHRFGGPYAKTVLIAPALENLHNGEQVRRRAEEMGIRVLDGTTLCSADDEELTRQLKCLWLNT